MQDRIVGLVGHTDMFDFKGFKIETSSASSTNRDSQKWCIASIQGNDSYELINKNTQFSLVPEPTAESVDLGEYLANTNEGGSIWGYQGDMYSGYPYLAGATWLVASTTADCTGPDGTTISNGDSVTYYQSSGSCNCAGESEVRTCTNGILSGSKSKPSCEAYCSGPGGACIANGVTSTFYKKDVSADCSLETENRTCSTGTLSGTAQYIGCNPPANENISIDSFRADSLYIGKGKSCNLEYSITSEDDIVCTITGGGSPTYTINVFGGVETKGVRTINNVLNTTRYTLTCGSGQAISANTRCSVKPQFQEI
jgi:hypothetical protein